MRIDSAELLNWVQEQAEEKSPNLTKFTEHFNNMSYWTRTLILNQPDAKVRGKGTEKQSGKWDETDIKGYRQRVWRRDRDRN